MDFKEFLVKEGGGNVVHTVQSKEDQTKPIFQHLKPLSLYGRMMACDHQSSVPTPCSSIGHFRNLKIEIVNNCAQKRKLEHSSCDDGYETPSKKFLFDLDVDDVLCLSPVSTVANTVVSNSEDPIGSIFRNEPGQKHGERDPQKKEEMKEDRNGKDELEDKGHFSVSYTELRTTTSSPLPRAGEHEAPQHGCHSENLTHQDSTTDSGLYSNGSMVALDSCNAHVRSFEDAESIPHIGLPIFESSLCCGDSAAGEHTREGLPEAATNFIDLQHTTWESEAGDTSYDTTSPLKVKVRSVVVVPKPHTTCFNADFPAPVQSNHGKLDPEEKEWESAASRPRIQRPAVLEGELTWEQDKNQYIHLVTKHINGKAENQDVMTELLSLMTQVADQTPVGDAPWRHPSDLTRRNYQTRFGFSTPQISLQEWQAKNCTTYKRFATVPRIFKRSPLP